LASVNQDAVDVGGFPGGEPVKATVAVALVSVSVAATVIVTVGEAAGAVVALVFREKLHALSRNVAERIAEIRMSLFIDQSPFGLCPVVRLSDWLNYISFFQVSY
jgi:hypothetical protein